MTAKQALRELVEDLSEEDAEEMLQRLSWEADPEELLTEGEAAGLRDAIAEGERGATVSGDEVFRSL